jgi:hypothetical protein
MQGQSEKQLHKVEQGKVLEQGRAGPPHHRQGGIWRCACLSVPMGMGGEGDLEGLGLLLGVAPGTLEELAQLCLPRPAPPRERGERGRGRGGRKGRDGERDRVGKSQRERESATQVGGGPSSLARVLEKGGRKGDGAQFSSQRRLYLPPSLPACLRFHVSVTTTPLSFCSRGRPNIILIPPSSKSPPATRCCAATRDYRCARKK